MSAGLDAHTKQLQLSNKELKAQLRLLQLQLVETQARLQQEQTKRQLCEDRSLEQAKRAAAVNAEIVKANSMLKQQQRLSKFQADSMKLENVSLRSAFQVRSVEDSSTIARLEAQLQAAQDRHQGLPLPAGSEAASKLAGLADKLLPDSQISRPQHRAPTATGMQSWTHVSSAAADAAAAAPDILAKPSNAAAAAVAIEPGILAKLSIAKSAIVLQSCTSLDQRLCNTARLLSPAHASTSQPGGTIATSNSLAEKTVIEVSRAEQSSCNAECQAEASQQSLQDRQSFAVTQAKSPPGSCLATVSPSGSDDVPQSTAESCLDHSVGIADTGGSRPNAYSSALRTQTPETKHSMGMQQLWDRIALTPLQVSSPLAALSLPATQGNSQQSDATVISGSSCANDTLVQEPPGDAARAASPGVTACQAVSPTPAAQDSIHSSSISLPSTDSEQPIPSAGTSDSSVRPEAPQSQQRRSSRTKPRVLYEEPKLGSKLRQGDAFTFGSAHAKQGTARRNSIAPRSRASTAFLEKQNTAPLQE